MRKPFRSLLCTASLLCLTTSTAFAAQILAPGRRVGSRPDRQGLGRARVSGAAAGERNANGNANAAGHAKPTAGNGISIRRPVDAGHHQCVLHLVRQLVGKHGEYDPDQSREQHRRFPYFNINTTYYDGSDNAVSNAVHYAGSTTDNYSQTTALSDAGVQNVVASAISSGRLPKDTNAVYFVLTSADVNETSGFCTQYCGWHTHGTISGSDIKYSFVGNPARCPSACAAQTTSPNNNAGADGMASIISHELEEAVTDPDLNAWYDRRGQENADKCAWTFGNTSTASNGSLYNVTLGGTKYLIQRNWVNAAGGYCAMQYP
jgi:hypothetical protein